MPSRVAAGFILHLRICIFSLLTHRRATRTPRSMRCCGEARARFLADQSACYQELLLAPLQILHRKQAHLGLVQQESQERTVLCKPGRLSGLAEIPDEDMAHSGASKNFQNSNGKNNSYSNNKCLQSLNKYLTTCISLFQIVVDLLYCRFCATEIRER